MREYLFERATLLPKNDSEIYQNNEKKESESVGVQISKKITSEFLMAV